MDNIQGDSLKMDSEFDQMLVEMRPHVLKLPHKSDRQRCALWIKKFCEDTNQSSNTRKNRNMYAQLLLHMLRRSKLEGPFVGRPEPGPLPTMPTYMSIYFDNQPSNGQPSFKGKENRVPDWVSGELNNDNSSLPVPSYAMTQSTRDLNSGRAALNVGLRSSDMSSYPSHSTGLRSMGENSYPLSAPGLKSNDWNSVTTTAYSKSAGDAMTFSANIPKFSDDFAAPLSRPAGDLLYRPDIGSRTSADMLYPSVNNGDRLFGSLPESNSGKLPLSMSGPLSDPFASHATLRLGTGASQQGDASSQDYSKQQDFGSYNRFAPPLIDFTQFTNSDGPSNSESTYPKSSWPIEPQKHSKGDKASAHYHQDVGQMGSSSSNVIQLVEKEVELRSKVLEAKFQEQSLKQQQQHDAAVQKILDRKNGEIEDLKKRYQHKIKEQEEALGKLEKKVQHQAKELNAAQESKEKQIDTLKRSLQENQAVREADLEKKLHDSLVAFEQERVELQRQHTKSIQELLNDTNSRLQKMEDEYKQQSESTCSVIRELELRIQQLTLEAESLGRAHSQLERDKSDQLARNERLQTEVVDTRSKCAVLEKQLEKLKSEHEQELRTLRNKNEAAVQFAKQEQGLQAVKAADTIADLEHHVQQLKQALENAEQQRAKQMKRLPPVLKDYMDMESTFHGEKDHLEALHAKKVKILQDEIERLEEAAKKQTKKNEQLLKEKDAEIATVKAHYREQDTATRKTLENLKAQVDQNSLQLFDEMKLQMQKVEADLNRSKQLRERQAKEFQRQIEEETLKHQQKIAQMQAAYEAELEKTLQQIRGERDQLLEQKEREIEQLKETFQSEIVDIEQRAREQQEKSQQVLRELEEQIQQQRDDLLQANMMRKQQLVELGLLREEEKSKMEREHTVQIARIRADTDQHRLELERKHSIAMEQVLEKTNRKLKDIEKEYSDRAHKANQTINDLHSTVQSLKEEQHKKQEAYNSQINSVKVNAEDEKRQLKQHYSAIIMNQQQENESLKLKLKQLERRLNENEMEWEEKVMIIRAQHEDNLRGLMPSSVRQELEDTISSLKSQISSLQQRAILLEEELGSNFSMSSKTNKLNSPALLHTLAAT